MLFMRKRVQLRALAFCRLVSLLTVVPFVAGIFLEGLDRLFPPPVTLAIPTHMEPLHVVS